MSDDQDAAIRQETQREIFEAIMRIREEVGSLVKDERNRFGGWKFSSIDQYYEKVSPIAMKHGIQLVPNVVDLRRISTGDNPDDKDMFLAKVTIDLYFRNGTVIREYQRMSFEHPIIGAQSTGSVLSYAAKNGMRSIFQIPSGEPDADSLDNREVLYRKPTPYVRRQITNQGQQNPPDYSVIPLPDAGDIPGGTSVSLEVIMKQKIGKIVSESALEGEWRDNKTKLAALRESNPDSHERIRIAFENRRDDIRKAVVALPAPSPLPNVEVTMAETSATKSKWTGGTRPVRTVKYPVGSVVYPKPEVPKERTNGTSHA